MTTQGGAKDGNTRVFSSEADIHFLEKITLNQKDKVFWHFNAMSKFFKMHVLGKAPAASGGATRLSMRGFVRILLCSALPLVAGCAAVEDLGREPKMSTVGSGLNASRQPLPGEFPAWNRHTGHSVWGQQGQTLYQDPRATNVGDVVTVMISIDDKAEFDNTSDRRRTGDANLGFDFGVDSNMSRSRSSSGSGSPNLGFDLGRDSNMGLSRSLSGSGSVNSSTRSRGEGSIDRSEKLRLSIAAVVTEVLSNGNLLISGSQEVRVNFEMRVLNIAGIVRPRDISRKNTIDYNKIAEARVSYGGRGRISEVQQPAVGQQIYDILTPF